MTVPIATASSAGAPDTILVANQYRRSIGNGISFGAENMIVVADCCGDTRAGDPTAAIELWANDFDGNALGPLELDRPSTRVDGVRTGRCLPTGLGINFARPRSYSIDARSTMVSIDVTLPSTRDGTIFGFARSSTARILVAAEEVFARSGFDAATLREVARRAAVAVGDFRTLRAAC